jgi:hypothetical protein
MPFSTLKAKKIGEHREFLVEYDEHAGYYLLVIDTLSGKTIADYLCEDLDEAFLEASERYGLARTCFQVACD